MELQARPSAPIAPPTRRGLSRVEAAGYIGFSPTTFDKMVLEGVMPSPKRYGTRKVWDRYALDLAFEALMGEDSGSDSATDSWSDL